MWNEGTAEERLLWAATVIEHSQTVDEYFGADYKERALDAEAERSRLWAGLGEFRDYLDRTFRFWCSPHALASDYATKLIDELDRFTLPDPPKEGS
jgi:hypothetical protein